LHPKCAKTRLRASVISKIFPRVIPPDPRYKRKEKGQLDTERGEEGGRKGGRERGGRGGEGKERNRDKGGDQGMGNFARYLFRKSAPMVIIYIRTLRKPFRLQKSLKKLLHQSIKLSVQNSLKLTYGHLQYQQLFRMRSPRTPKN
jgi:hypothetical protein